MDNKELTKIYVCSPCKGIKGDGGILENLPKARQYCKFIIQNFPDMLPIAPHLYLTNFMDDSKPNERKLALEFGKHLLAECKEIWVFGYLISDGMAAEITEAGRLQIPIRWFTEECKERAAAELQRQNNKKNITAECYFDASPAIHTPQHLSKEIAGVFNE